MPHPLFQRASAMLNPCGFIADIGCGIYPHTLVPCAIYLGVDPHRPYLTAMQQKVASAASPHPITLSFCGTWEDWLDHWHCPIPDMVVLLDVIEHLPKAEGLRLLDRTVAIGAKVVVFTPLGFMPQHYEGTGTDPWGLGGLEYQEHRSGWLPEDFPGWTILVDEGFHHFPEGSPKRGDPFGAFFAISP